VAYSGIFDRPKERAAKRAVYISFVESVIVLRDLCFRFVNQYGGDKPPEWGYICNEEWVCDYTGMILSLSCEIETIVDFQISEEGFYTSVFSKNSQFAMNYAAFTNDNPGFIITSMRNMLQQIIPLLEWDECPVLADDKVLTTFAEKRQLHLVSMNRCVNGTDCHHHPSNPDGALADREFDPQVSGAGIEPLQCSLQCC
jgi:hypothetical protein